MSKTISLRENDVIVLKISENSFTVAQMRTNGIMEFFDVVKNKNEWGDLDLGEIVPIFYIFVAEKNLTPIVVEKLSGRTIRRSVRPVPKMMLSVIIKSVGQYEFNLVELTEFFSSYGAKVIRRGVEPNADRDVIYRRELAGVHGDSEKIRRRLETYFATGVNWDESKHILFPNIEPPPPSSSAR